MISNMNKQLLCVLADAHHMSLPSERTGPSKNPTEPSEPSTNSEKQTE